MLNTRYGLLLCLVITLSIVIITIGIHSDGRMQQCQQTGGTWIDNQCLKVEIIKLPNKWATDK